VPPPLPAGASGVSGRVACGWYLTVLWIAGAGGRFDRVVSSHLRTRGGRDRDDAIRHRRDGVQRDGRVRGG
jgi:hypothetical protein